MADPMRISDPRALRAIAHPLRNRILSELFARGSARAVDLARTLDVPANSASFHLRELARFGLIAEDPDHSSDGRDRWWVPTGEAGYTADTSGSHDPASQAAVRVLDRHAAARAHAVVDRVHDSEPGLDSVTASTVPMALTDAEARQLDEELSALLHRWIAHGRERQRAGDTDGRRSFLTLTFTLPQDLLDEATPGDH